MSEKAITMRPQGSRRASAEEYSIIGVILFCFGLTWVEFAHQQPLIFSTTGCVSYGSSPLPPCASLTWTAIVFYTFGVAALVTGIVFILIRISIWRRVHSHDGSRSP